MDKKGVILVVDDDKEVTISLKGFFTALGHEMLMALDGKEALKIINSISLDLIILDVRMPGIDGIQILKHVRTKKPKTKVIIITGYEDEVKKDVEKLGVDGFFAKPIDLAKLLGRIRYVLEAAKATRVYPTKEKTEKPITQVPKARLLFIEPSIQMYAFTSGLFDNPHFCTGEYERKAIYGNADYLAGIILEELVSYQPDIILINDYAMDEDKILSFVELVKGIKIKPEAIVVHGLFERNAPFETRLKMKGVDRCIQNIMNHEELIEMNKKLIDFVSHECVKHKLVKK